MTHLEDQHPTVQALRGIFGQMVSKDPHVAAEGDQRLAGLVEEDGDVRFHRSHQLNSQSRVLAQYILSTLTNMFSHPDSRPAGVRVISTIIDVDFCELSTRTTRFSFLLLSAAVDTSPTTAAAVAAWGRLISNGSGLVGDITRTALERVLALFIDDKGQANERSARRYVACLLLFQLADRAPNVLLSADIDGLRVGLEKSISDPLEMTRRAAAKALRRLLDVCIRSDGGGVGGGANASSNSFTSGVASAAAAFSAIAASGGGGVGAASTPTSSTPGGGMGAAAGSASGSNSSSGGGGGRQQILNRLLDFAAAGFTNKSPAVQHGGWLAFNTTLAACGEAIAAANAALAAEALERETSAPTPSTATAGGGARGRMGGARVAAFPSSASVSNMLASSSHLPTTAVNQQQQSSSADATALRLGIDPPRMQRVWDYVLQTFMKVHASAAAAATSSSSGSVLTSSSSSSSGAFPAPEVKVELRGAVPLMAAYDTEGFLRRSLSDVLAAAVAVANSPSAAVEDKNQMFLMIGRLSAVIKGHISAYVDRIVRTIEGNLITTVAAPKRPRRDRCAEAVTCLAMLAQADPASVQPYISELLNPIFSGPPTVDFAKNIASLCRSFPEYRSACLDRMIALVRRQLATVPLRNFLAANEASNTARLVDAFTAIRELDCEGFSLLDFLASEVAPRFWDPHQQVRRMAADLCSRLLLCGCRAPGSPCRVDAEGLIIHAGAPHIALILRLQQQLLAVAVADPEPDIRLGTLGMLDSRFDHTLSVQDCVRAIIPALNDRHQNRAAAVALLGRLSRRNPAAVFPTLRKVLVQCITETAYLRDATDRFSLGGADERRLEQATITLGEVVAAAPDLIAPYRGSLLRSTAERLAAPGASPLVLTALLACLGHLAGHTRDEEDLAIVRSLVPSVVAHVLDATSSAKKQEAIRTLTSIVRATRDVSLYDTYPALLPALLSVLHGGFKEPWTCRRDVLELLGVVGAVDPVKVKAILRQTKEGSEANANFRARPEDLPPTVVTAVLSVMRLASSNEEVLSLSAQALREIFVSGAMRMGEAVGYLSRVISEFRRHIAQSPALREKFLKELALLVSYFKHHIRAYREELFDTLRQQIRPDAPPAVLSQCLFLLSELRSCLREEFRPYLPSLLPLLVGTLHSDATPERKSALLVLESFTALGRLLDVHLHVVLPEVIEVAVKCPNVEARELAIVTILNFAKHLPSLADHSARCVHCLLRVIAEPLPTTKADPKGLRLIPHSTHTQCLQALAAIAQNLGDGFAKFIPMVRPALAARFRENSVEYERAMCNYAEAIVGGKTIHPEPPYQPSSAAGDGDGATGGPAFFLQQQQQLQRMPEAQRFRTLSAHMAAMGARTTDEEGWKPWLHQLCVQLLRASSSATLRVCANLAQAHEPFARLLFYPAFASCFAEMSEMRALVGRVITHALEGSRHATQEVRQEVLNLAEYMERVEEFASKPGKSSSSGKSSSTAASSSASKGGVGPGGVAVGADGKPLVPFSALVKVDLLATHSERSNLYAKTIHYLELQFVDLTREFRETLLSGRVRPLRPEQWQKLLGICEQAIKLCNYLNMSETANGILSFIRRHYGQLTGEVTPANANLRAILQAGRSGGAGAGAGGAAFGAGGVSPDGGPAGGASGAGTPTAPSPAVAANNATNSNNNANSANGSSGFAELSAEMYEKLQWWSQSLAAYEAKARQDPHSTANVLGIMRSLEGVGDYPRLLDMFRAAVRRGNRRLLLAASPTGARAAWLMQKWDDLRLATDLMPKEGYNMTIASFYRAVLAARADQLSECQRHIDDCRRHLDSSLSALVSESYDRAYPRLVDLQQLSELEEVCLAKRDPTAIPALKELWGRRLLALSHSPTEWQGTLANHTLVVSPQEELPMWIQFVSLCRSHNRGVVARAALTQLMGNRTVEDVLGSIAAASSAVTVANAGNGTVAGGAAAALLSSSAAAIASPTTSHSGLGGIASPITAGASDAALSAFASSSSGGAALAARAGLSSSMNAGTVLSISTTATATAMKTGTNTTTTTFASASSNSHANNNGAAIVTRPIVALAALSHTYESGRRDEALALLARYVATAAPPTATVSAIGADGADPSITIGNPSSASASSPATYAAELALCRARLGEWLCHRNPHYVRDTNLRDTIIHHLAEATRLDPTNGSVWRQWARVQHDVADALTNSPSSKDSAKKKAAATTAAGDDESSSGSTPIPLASSAGTAAAAGSASPSSGSSPTPTPTSATLSIAAQRDGHIVSAIEGYLSSIRIGHQLQDVLGFLSLWFTHGSRPAVAEAVANGIPQIFINVWLSVIPQIIARIQAASPRIQEAVHNLLVAIAKAHPQALLYALNAGIDPFSQPPPATGGDSAAATGSSPEGENAAKDTADEGGSGAAASEEERRRRPRERILSKIEEIHGPEGVRMVAEARMVTQELIRCAVLWPERWLDELQTIHKQWTEDDDLGRVVEGLAPLVALLDAPRTSAEENFVSEHGAHIREGYRLMGEAAAHRTPSAAAAKAKEAWSLLDDLYNRFDAQVKSITTLVMDYVSPRLVTHGRNQSIAVPGTYAGRPDFPRIASFVPGMAVMNSKQHPRRIGIMGSDGLRHAFLLKGHEDLRQDERVMQLLGLVNTVIETHNGTRRRECTVQLYSVTPLGDRAGLVGWVDGCDTLHAIIKDYRGNSLKAICAEQNVIKGIVSVPEGIPMVVQRQEMHERAHEVTAGMDIARSLWSRATSSEVWLGRRTTYVRTLASMSMVGHILGLGDRHPSNLMIHAASGRVVHIDFGDCFEVAMHRSMYPEKVPFRLTRMLVNAMEVSGIDGLFRHGCEAVMSVLRRENTSMLALLEAFVHDPLVSWQLNEGEQQRAAKEQQRAVEAAEAAAAALLAGADAGAAAAVLAATDAAAGVAALADGSAAALTRAAVAQIADGGASLAAATMLRQQAASFIANKNTTRGIGAALTGLGAVGDLADLDLAGASIRSVRGMTVRSLHPAARGAAAGAGTAGGGKTVAANTNKQATEVIARIREKLNGMEFVDPNDFMCVQQQQRLHRPVSIAVVAAPTAERSATESSIVGDGSREGSTLLASPDATPLPAAGASTGATVEASFPPPTPPPMPAAPVVSSLPVPEQVDRLIQEAVSSENLCQHYQGWCAFW